ncbi:unnamed protein product [Owenia fusiformis]|uniref:Uncharacterized protein n=1 Tax=Owenia fusiformis TaxID=6347 RepID=A0A8J1TCB5_OWEFU|nr:unnamed protein product [Owenia fusiformis]
MRGKKSAAAGTIRILFGMIILLDILHDATSEDQEKASTPGVPRHKTDGDSNTTDTHLSSYSNITTISNRANIKNQNETGDGQITLWISLAYLGGIVSGCILGVMISYVINVKKYSQCWTSKEGNEQEAAKPILVKSSDNKEIVKNEYLDTRPNDELLYLNVIEDDKDMKVDVEKGESQAKQTEGKTRDPTHNPTDDIRDLSSDRSSNSPTGEIYKNQRFFNEDVHSTTDKSSPKPEVKDETIRQGKRKAKKRESDTEPPNLINDQEIESDQFYVNVDHKKNPRRFKPSVARKPSFLRKVFLHKGKTLDPCDKAYEHLGRESMSGPSNTSDLYEPLQRGTI